MDPLDRVPRWEGWDQEGALPRNGPQRRGGVHRGLRGSLWKSAPRGPQLVPRPSTSSDADPLLQSELWRQSDTPRGTHQPRKRFYKVLSCYSRTQNPSSPQSLLCWPISSSCGFPSIDLSRASFKVPCRVTRAAFPSLPAPSAGSTETSAQPTPAPPLLSPHLGPCLLPGLPLQPPRGQVHRKCRHLALNQPLAVLGQGPVSRTVTSPLPEAVFQVLSLQWWYCITTSR